MFQSGGEVNPILSRIKDVRHATGDLKIYLSLYSEDFNSFISSLFKTTKHDDLINALWGFEPTPDEASQFVQ